MMNSIALALSLACPKTTVENTSVAMWTRFDQKILVNSVQRCQAKYPQSPCLKRFRKTADRAHQATCGGNDQFAAR